MNLSTKRGVPPRSLLGTGCGTSRSCGTFVSVAMVLFIFFVFSGCNNEEASRIKRDGKKPGKTLTRLPRFQGKTIEGNGFDSSGYRGQPLFVQFIDTANIDDVDFLETVFHNWENFDLSILAITKTPENFRQVVSIEPGQQEENRFAVTAEYEKFKQVFKAPACCHTYYLFNRDGKLIKTGYTRTSYEKALKAELNQVLKNKVFHISDFIPENESVKQIGWLDQCWRFVDKERKYVVVCLLRNVCDTCFSGVLLNRLNTLHSRCNDRGRVISIVPQDFTDTDIENLKGFLGVRFGIQRATPELETYWKAKIEEFRENDVTNILFLIDKSGTIIKVAGNDPVMIKDFFIFSDKLITRSKP